MLELNLKNKAITQTTKRYNSMCKFGDKYLGTSDAGLFNITGHTDNADPITAFFKTITTDLALSNPKRLRHLVVSYISTDDLLVEAYVNERLIGGYSIPASSDKINRRRIKLGQGVKGTHLAFKFSNTKGCVFTIFSVDLFFEVLENFTTKEGL